MKSKITLHTQINREIADSKAGKDCVIAAWNWTPINVLKAARALNEEKLSNVEIFGEIGCGCSWLELDGNYIDVEPLNRELVCNTYYPGKKNGKKEIAEKFISNHQS